MTGDSQVSKDNSGWVLMPRDHVAALPCLHALADASGMTRLPDPNEDGSYPITGKQSTVRQWYDAMLAAAPPPAAERQDVRGKCYQGDMRQIDGQWWVCTDPDMDRWISHGEMSSPLAPKDAAPAPVLGNVLSDAEVEWLNYAIAHMQDDNEPEDATCADVLQCLLDRTHSMRSWPAPAPAPAVGDAKDAERYRFLRNHAMFGTRHDPAVLKDGPTDCCEFMFSEELDQAIDEAIAARAEVSP